MSVPEGYAVAPTSADHICKLAVPVPGREDPILIEAPKIGWLTPEEHAAVRKFSEALIEAEVEVDQWHEENDPLPEEERAPYPEAAAKKIGRNDPDKSFTMLREMKLRWIKPYVSAKDYTTLTTSKKIPENTILWIFDQLKSPDITVGESAASSDS